MATVLGNGYESSDDDVPQSKPVPPSRTVSAAPEISLEVGSLLLRGQEHQTNTQQGNRELQIALANPTSNALTYNVTYDNLARPSQGPSNPFKASNGNALKRKNVPTGHAEETSISDTTFNTQHRTYQSLGYTKDPTQNGALVGSQPAMQRYGGKDVVQLRHSKAESDAIRSKRQKKGDSGIVDGDGAYLGPWAKYQGDDVAYEEAEAMAGQELASDEEWVEEGVVAPLPAPSKLATDYNSSDASVTETTEFKGSQQLDYQGRTYMHVPQDLDVDLGKDQGSQQCYVPKKLVHQYKYHTKPITSLKFIPHSSHLLLSSAADTKLALWDAHHDRELLRTFSGHTKSITDTDWSPDGKQFLSASYDRYMKLWDTETGKCISRFTTGKTPHTLRFQPSNGGVEFIAGMNDKKIIQYDTRSGELVQEYDHHLGPINTLTFVDENRRFMSTSDDKSLRAWEYGIPVPIKFIADPSMFALTKAAPHPSGKYVAYQSADNQIVVYAAGEKFRQNRKKGFRGMNTSGYAIDVAISPDGGIIASGDSGGYVCFWDWKTGKMWHKIQAGGGKEGGVGGAVTSVAWHGQETKFTRLITSSSQSYLQRALQWFALPASESLSSHTLNVPMP
ncbi:hypothetical protein LTR70_002797 [Exophiala xenobiotica]|uniref:Uncharacterized protein n=1 Tax=Lithohypha guttulata TaxID=1690604 RepID=A0ABR0KJ76_9EURO|nr:hypothetical protein LTR24_002011 [Lithohypha guttulata]KAK5324513.1 hypothetical protein LTR70_002797 [Exophiala xenobiotica]